MTNTKAQTNTAKMAQPEPEVVGPTDEELLELWHGSDWYDEGATLGEFRSIARAVLARWGTPNLVEIRSSLGEPSERQAAPVPVAVSERLPGDALCWWYEPDEDDDLSGYGGCWTLLRIRGAVSFYTHWLPAHALPLPSVKVQP